MENCNWFNYVKDISQLIISLSALLLSIVAFKLSRKITFKKTIREKQFDIVSELINNFRNTFIVLSYQHSSRGGANVLFLSNLKDKDLKDKYPDLYDRKAFLISNNIQVHFKFLKLYESPFLPDSIKVEMVKFWTSSNKTISRIEVSELDDYIILDEVPNSPLYSNAINIPTQEDFRSFENFQKFINHFIDTINEWLKKNDAKELIIN